jgi:hypothetical protein
MRSHPFGAPGPLACEEGKVRIVPGGRNEVLNCIGSIFVLVVLYTIHASDVEKSLPLLGKQGILNLICMYGYVV